jgi:hypothetical protein
MPFRWLQRFPLLCRHVTSSTDAGEDGLLAGPSKAGVGLTWEEARLRTDDFDGGHIPWRKRTHSAIVVELNAFHQELTLSVGTRARQEACAPGGPWREGGSLL